jgi:hypothetical protein
MPHDVLLDYLKEVEKAIGHLPDAYVELYEEEFLTNERALMNSKWGTYLKL